MDEKYEIIEGGWHEFRPDPGWGFVRLMYKLFRLFYTLGKHNDTVEDWFIAVQFTDDEAHDVQ